MTERERGGGVLGRSKAKSTATYRGQNKNKEGISPQAPKLNKTGLWTQILKQEVKCQWHHNCITIDWTCCHIHVVDIEAPGSSVISVFFHEVGGTISKRSKHEYQCSGDPDKPISTHQGEKANVRYSWNQCCCQLTIRFRTQRENQKEK